MPSSFATAVALAFTLWTWFRMSPTCTTGRSSMIGLPSRSRIGARAGSMRSVPSRVFAVRLGLHDRGAPEDDPAPARELAQPHRGAVAPGTVSRDVPRQLEARGCRARALVDGDQLRRDRRAVEALAIGDQGAGGEHRVVRLGGGRGVLSLRPRCIEPLCGRAGEALRCRQVPRRVRAAVPAPRQHDAGRDADAHDQKEQEDDATHPCMVPTRSVVASAARSLRRLPRAPRAVPGIGSRGRRGGARRSAGSRSSSRSWATQSCRCAPSPRTRAGSPLLQGGHREGQHRDAALGHGRLAGELLGQLGAEGVVRQVRRATPQRRGAGPVALQVRPRRADLRPDRRDHQTARTPYSALHDIDANKPAGRSRSASRPTPTA